MTLKLSQYSVPDAERFGTILNNMTLKQSYRHKTKIGSFGTILNNMTLKPRRSIFSP